MPLVFVLRFIEKALKLCLSESLLQRNENYVQIAQRYIASGTSSKSVVRRLVVALFALAAFAVLVVAAYLALFAWFANTGIARVYSTPYDNFVWGMLHGFFLPTSFILSLFDSTITLYQTPNTGNWYNFGFIVGIMHLSIIMKFAKYVNKWRSTRRRSGGRP